MADPPDTLHRADTKRCRTCGTETSTPHPWDLEVAVTLVIIAMALVGARLVWGLL